jgi:hypothetical protein
MGSTAPSAPIPSQARSKNLRACLLCSIIQTPVDFRRNGCPNCEDIMQVNRPPLPSVRNTDVLFLFKHFLYTRTQKNKQMKGSPDRIQACTTTHFDGSIAVTDPEKSWVARWQRTSAFFSCHFSTFTFFFSLLCLRMLMHGDR